MSDNEDTKWKSLYEVADSVSNWLPEGNKKTKCECGCSKTLDKDDHPSLHSSWCPIYEEWKKEQK